ncbi:unnamed protein product [Camellia sinensis]
MIVLVCFLVGALLWLVKTLVVKVLASSFHVSTFFDRIQESLFNQFVTEVVSRLPIEDSLEEGFYSFGSCGGHLVDAAHSHSICNRDSKVFVMLDTTGLVPKPTHRCRIPIVDDPDKIIIPKRRTPDKVVRHLSYILEDEVENNGSQSPPLFGGHQSWLQREESFKLKSIMKMCTVVSFKVVVQRWLQKTKYVEKCRFVVASGIFDGYDVPHQPSNKNVTVREDNDGGQWVGIWRIILLKHQPYDEPRRNGKVPKILTHRLFPQAQYSIWIDGKMELIVDPLLMLERYLWRGKHTFAIAQHKHHHSIYEEADANKRRKRYARPLIDLHMKIYRYEGMKAWSPKKKTVSATREVKVRNVITCGSPQNKCPWISAEIWALRNVPEGAIIIREHTALNDLFSCLWFNEINLFTPRDQLSFGYVVYRLGHAFKFFMSPNCEYNSIFVLHPHTREHSSKIEWVKSLDEFKGKNSGLKESRGGLGLWTPYPGNLDSVVLPHVTRTSKAG